MRTRFPITIAMNLLWLYAVPIHAQVLSVSVSPPSPIVNQPATVTVSGQGPCNTLLIDFGDGNGNQIFDPSVLPFATSFTWTTIGLKTIAAAAYGNCDGQASVTVQVNQTGSTRIAQLCATINCSERPAMSFPRPEITGDRGWQTPGGLALLDGDGFGSSTGSVTAVLRNWSGKPLQFTLEVVEWTNTIVAVRWPTYIQGVRRQSAAVALTNRYGKRDWHSVTFDPALSIKTLSMEDVKTVSCGGDSNHDVCNNVSHDIHPSFVYIPPELSATSAMLGAHMNRWGAVGNDTGTDSYEIVLKRDWTLESLHWKVSAEPLEAFVRKPAGFAKTATWSPSVEWEVTPNDQVVYAAVLTIRGPVGVPHK